MVHETVTGKKPTGWYTGRCSVNTVGLVAEAGGFSWQSDCYDDDLPPWVETDAGPQLMIPYTLDANDMRFATAQGFNTGDDFYHYLKDSFDCLREEMEWRAQNDVNRPSLPPDRATWQSASLKEIHLLCAIS